VFVDLDDPSGLDPVRVGGKAAALAAARAAGIAVLPGFVVDGSLSVEHMAKGADALATRGSGGARLVISAEPVGFENELTARGEALAPRLVARSSTLLESSGEWSGAFSSYLDIGPDELPKAVTGCWASAFTVAALARLEAAGIEAGSFPMSVLVQQAIEPEVSGWAEIGADGRMAVHGVKGPPAPLLQGWVNGHSAFHDGEWQGGELVDLLGTDALDEIRWNLGRAGHSIGSNRCEWAVIDRVWVLQLGRSRHATSRVVPTLILDVPDEMVTVARVAVMAPGALGEEMVIPWALGGAPAAPDGTTVLVADPVGTARILCRELTEEVWGRPWEEAASAAADTISSLRGSDPVASVGVLGRLRPPDNARASRLLGILHRLRIEMVDLGVTADEDESWHLNMNSIAAGLEGKRPPLPQRLGIGRWEPLVAAVTLSASTPMRGSPVSSGLGAGRRVELVEPHRATSSVRRAVVTASHPLAGLASALWDSAGMVTASGSRAAHLFEAARALRVPAVSGVDLGPAHGEIVAVDGEAGLVATLDLRGEA
jgi:Pyruvate phosphate dikinase, AMP/ATP-binding domain/PEP-utilising enzyme, mobile domain